jgi:hypothetical protein
LRSAGEVKDQMRKIDSSYECGEELPRALLLRSENEGVSIEALMCWSSGIGRLAYFNGMTPVMQSCKPWAITYRGCVSMIRGECFVLCSHVDA